MPLIVENREALLIGDPSGRRALALDMVEAALDAVEPERATARALDAAQAQGIDLRGAFVVALGKAARPMAEAARARLGATRGLVIAPEARPVGAFETRVGEHPVSGPVAIDNGEALMAFARAVPAGAAVLFLVSGGGSAMAEVPADGIDADALLATNRALLASGAPIEVVNAVRRRLSRLKGGGLARALAHARVVTIVLSDTPGLPASTVASGPTIALEHEPDISRALSRYGLESTLPAAALALVERTVVASEAPRGELFVAADNAVARSAAADVAKRVGLEVVERVTPISGEARETGRALYAEALKSDAAAFVAGGETTVTLRGSGRGGRNHELCLATASVHDGGLVLSVGTDGVDGTSGAAGALLDEGVRESAAALGLDAGAHLSNNDSGPYFARAGAQLLTGPTGTNVADLFIYLR